MSASLLSGSALRAGGAFQDDDFTITCRGTV